VEIVDVETVGAEAVLVHDAHAADPSTAFALSRLTDAGHLHQAPVGIFRQVERPTYDDLARQQVSTAKETLGPGDLAALMAGKDSWHIR
jgi:2-oxoglutarate ferredoxin oxidoreductase subunit beta